MRKVIIHIGLHKTATRFLVNDLFSNIHADEIEYNPGDLLKSLKKLFRNVEDKTLRIQTLTLVETIMQRSTLPLLISKCDIAGNMYDAYHTYRQNIELLKTLFPDAEIIYFTRHPADWLLSAYKQSLVRGSCGSIDSFLNFYNDQFHPKRAKYLNRMRNIEALSLPFLDIYQACCVQFGETKTHLFCYEDLRSNRDSILNRIQVILGLSAIPVSTNNRYRNKSFSALAIKLFCFNIRSRRQLIFSDRTTPFWLKKNVIKPLRKLRAGFIRHVFDKLIYRDWDLLARNAMRQQLDDRYNNEYSQLREKSHRQLGLLKSDNSTVE